MSASWAKHSNRPLFWKLPFSPCGSALQLSAIDLPAKFLADSPEVGTTHMQWVCCFPEPELENEPSLGTRRLTSKLGTWVAIFPTVWEDGKSCVRVNGVYQSRGGMDGLTAYLLGSSQSIELSLGPQDTGLRGCLLVAINYVRGSVSGCGINSQQLFLHP